MAEPLKTPIATRKLPQQTRSAELVADILDGTIQVLREEGARRFTTARVAERAGVSVGSIYQYFPNKAAILFRLQTDEWRATMALLRALLSDVEKAPLERLRNLVHAFVRSECDEFQLRSALRDAAPFYRDAPETQQTRQEGEDIFLIFLEETLPEISEEARQLGAELISTTLGTVGKHFSESQPDPERTTPYADALADMLCAYVRSLSPVMPYQY